MITWVVLSGVLYMLLLFWIANRAEKIKNHKLLKHPMLHMLALAVYCTTWTYYGGIGRVTTNGIDFLSIYLGPTIMLGLCFGVMQKIFKISKQLHITSIADFISVRYGKNATLGVLITVCSVFGIVPYIALQLKAIVTSLEVFNHVELLDQSASATDYSVIAISTTIVLAIFSILYGARKLDTSEKHQGLIAVIAFESLFKLIVFLCVGVFIVFFVFDGFADITEKLSSKQDIKHLFTLSQDGGYTSWFTMICLSCFAIILLPRQFHVNFVENDSLNNIKQSTWSLPLYFIIINFLVLPIALGGMYLFHNTNVSPDNYLIAIPLYFKANGLAIFTWLGGLSAATGMIIVETIALSIMISNSIVIPLFLTTYRVRYDEPRSNINQILTIRRLSILGVLFLALVFYLIIAQSSSLVSIGLISFGAVANFAPGLFAGLFFKHSNSKGIIAGLSVGFVVWMFTSLLPHGVSSQIVSKELVENGLFGISFLKPNALFGLSALDPLSHSLFWTLGLNVLTTIIFSMFTKKTSQESYYAEVYVDNQNFDSSINYQAAWKGNAKLEDLYYVLGNFIGMAKAQSLINKYAEKKNMNLSQGNTVPNELVAFTERLLGGVVGTIAARSIIKRSTDEEEISFKEMYAIIKENQKVKASNIELRKKSIALQKAGEALHKANQELNKADQQKNEFLYTVTHEIKTPLTSIIALSEIVNDNPDLDDEEKGKYLQSVISEANRLSHLINQVLKLEKYEAGKQRLNIKQVDLSKLITSTAETFEGIIKNKSLLLDLHLTNAMMLVSCDAELIKQVLVNLLGNAIKYAQSQITIHTHFTEDEWQVWVSDDGKGISESEKHLIFDKFFQAQNQNLKKPEGSGLGLAISKKILDLHNGKIWADTSYAKGAHIVFSLPIHAEQNQNNEP